MVNLSIDKKRLWLKSMSSVDTDGNTFNEPKNASGYNKAMVFVSRGDGPNINVYLCTQDFYSKGWRDIGKIENIGAGYHVFVVENIGYKLACRWELLEAGTVADLMISALLTK